MDKNNFFVNQVGYKTFSKKQAFFKDDSSVQKSFSILDKNGNVVYSGLLSESKKENLADENYRVVDFSDFCEPGKYSLKVEDSQSFAFEISDFVYNSIFFDTVHYFYLSRCGVEINSAAENGKWNHPACHTSAAEIYGEPGKTKKVLGGWHDAGDYGRYTIAVTKAAMDLMLTAELLKEKNISKKNPELKVTYEGLLDEVRFSLDWLLQMQREDGAVYHKISCYHFCAFIMPQDERDVQVLAPVSTAATADFAGCLAFAYRFFKDSDKVYAQKLLDCAVRAQEYLDCHEDEIYKNPPEITTGNYGDGNVKDERFFGLAALYCVTGNKKYLNNALEIRAQAIEASKSEEIPWKKAWGIHYGWGSVAGYGVEILLKYCNLDQTAKNELLQEFEQRANACLEVCKDSVLGLCVKGVGWGSNGHICDEAHVMYLAYELTKNVEFLEACQNQLNYILGCNPMNICYVTKNGTNCSKNTHHRPSGALKDSMPGMLAGGPCQGLADEVAKKNLEGKPPLKCYIDHQGSYSTNEIDIYWNSPLVYLLATLI